MILEAIKTLEEMDEKTHKTGIQKYIKNKEHKNVEKELEHDLKIAINKKLFTMVESRQLILRKQIYYHRCPEPQL